MSFNILIAEDEEITRKHLQYFLEKEGYAVRGVQNGIDALTQIEKEGFDILIADIKMPKMDGMALLDVVKEKYPGLEVIIITGFGGIEQAVAAMKKGAQDYITKPFNLDELSLKIGKIRERKGLEKENLALKVSLNQDKKTPFIAQSKQMQRVIETINSLSHSDCNVLITGKTGVGKGLVAKLVHYTSLRKNKPFLSINCPVFTEDLLASELFGYEKGAFTGAATAKQGLIEIANHGTLFLDEIAEMSPNLQAKLLKVIEDKEFFRVGGIRPIRVDVRFIAATNQNIKAVVSSGQFREDLYYRLNVMDIHLPSLRERGKDIIPLSKFFLDKHAKRLNKKIKGFSQESMDILLSYSFPGNVRELENMIERAVILEKSQYITPESLPNGLKLFQVETLPNESVRTLDEVMQEYTKMVLESAGENKSKAAELLGISRTSLWRILKRQ